jgi:chemotaxis signal transduction protein
VAQTARKYLTFRIARFDYAMDAERVRAIVPMGNLIRLGADASSAEITDLLGFTNIGGRMLPVIDVRRKLNLPASGTGRDPQIVVVALAAPDSQADGFAGRFTGDPGHQIGFVADRVSDVLEYRERDLRNGLLKGLGRPRRLLEVSELMTEQELIASLPGVL